LQRGSPSATGEGRVVLLADARGRLDELLSYYPGLAARILLALGREWVAERLQSHADRPAAAKPCRATTDSRGRPLSRSAAFSHGQPIGDWRRGPFQAAVAGRRHKGNDRRIAHEKQALQQSTAALFLNISQQASAP
jgi:hypothetical protein